MTQLAVALLWFVWSPEIEAATFPPEPVCEAAYRAAEQRHCLAKELYDVGGSWPLRQRMEAAERDKAILWASWWITWSRATPEDRRWWLNRYRELSQGE